MVKKMKTFSVVLDEETYEKVRKQAFKERQSIGAWVRMVMQEALKKK